MKRLTAAQVDAMVAMPKAVTSQPRLLPKSSPRWADARWPVKHELDPVTLDLLLHVQAMEDEQQKFSVSLMWNDEPVRRLCVGFGHDSLDPEGVHLHCYHDRLLMDFATELSVTPRHPADGVLLACEYYGISFKAPLVIPSPSHIQYSLYQE